jgi:hypothetical protein
MTDEPRETPHDSENEHEADKPFDVDAEFAKIVEAYGDEPAEVTPPPTPEGLAERFKTHGWSDAPQPPSDDPLNTAATWDDEGHFIPPEPPPLPVPEPHRLVAWIGVLGAPLVMLVLVVFRVTPPGWLSFLLVVGFVGGFVSLVATMKRDEDHWPGDDGAVL